MTAIWEQTHKGKSINYRFFRRTLQFFLPTQKRAEVRTHPLNAWRNCSNPILIFLWVVNSECNLTRLFHFFGSKYLAIRREERVDPRISKHVYVFICIAFVVGYHLAIHIFCHFPIFDVFDFKYRANLVNVTLIIGLVGYKFLLGYFDGWGFNQVRSKSSVLSSGLTHFGAK